jgi:ubiquinol-cytochrome c reductase cytochrome c subunit
MVLPALVVVAVGMSAFLTSGPASGASPTSGSASTGLIAHKVAKSSKPTKSSKSSPIHTLALPSSYIAPGRQLFEENCSACHGPAALGTSRAPNLTGLGAATVDFWVGTGRMPLADASLQAVPKPSHFTTKQVEEIAAFVTSLSPVNGPGIPVVNTKTANLTEGNSLFVLNCAACHTITGSGDALADGYFATSLHAATPTQVAEAIRTGPGNMPRFGPGELSNKEVADIVAYVTGPIKHPDNRGGIGLGGVGPVAEGFVALLVGVGGLMLVAFWLGDRA